MAISKARNSWTSTPSLSMREKIMSAAATEFSKYGIDGTSLRQIAERAETQKQLITHHFGTKDRLLREVVDDQLSDGVELLARIRKIEKLEGPEVALRTFVSEYIEWCVGKTDIVRIVFNESATESEVSNWMLDTHFRPLFKLIKRLIKDSQKLGLVNPGKPEHLYFTIFGIMNGRLIYNSFYTNLTGIDPFSPKETAALKDTVFQVLGLSRDGNHV